MTQNKPTDFQKPIMIPIWRDVTSNISNDDDEINTIKQCIKTRGIIGGSKIA